MTRVKICGIMNQKDALICIKHKVDILGFVVEYPILFLEYACCDS